MGVLQGAVPSAFLRQEQTVRGCVRERAGVTSPFFMFCRMVVPAGSEALRAGMRCGAQVFVGGERMKVPNHVAIILDGNGRWAKSKGMPRNYGHVRGAQNLEVICRDAYNLGIKYLTVYLFSTENWKRSPDEVAALMKLFRKYTKTCIKTARDNNMKVRVLGEPGALDPDLQESLRNLVESSKDNTGLNFQIAINYGSRDEIVRAIRRAAQDCVDGKLRPEQIDEQCFSGYLDTAEVPDPDLLIRTSGELRLSNYLLWQLAYTEFYFTEVPWPAFDKAELIKAIEKYNSRDRRYGGIKEEA